MSKPQIKFNTIDKAVAFFSPTAAIGRAKSRMALARAEQMGYIIPGSTKKTMKGVVASSNSPARDTAKKLRGSSALSRDMFMNTPIAVAAVNRCGANVVGSGLMPQIMPDHDALGITQEAAKDWAKTVERTFDTWAVSKNSDATGLHNFYDNQMVAFLSTLLNGDILFTTPWIQDTAAKKWPWELRLRLIEADLVRNPDDKPYHLTKDIISGIEFENGRWAAAHVANFYPSQIPYLDAHNVARKWERIPLYDINGRQNIYHLMPPGGRVGQRRAMGFLAPIVDMLKTLGRHSESYLVGQLIESLFTVFIKDMSAQGGFLNEGYTPDETANGGGTVATDENGQQGLAKDDGSELDIEMGPGNIVYLDDQKEVQFADPKRNPEGFDPFFKAMVRQIGAALEIPAEQLMLEFNESYSAARAALLEAWKMYKRRRMWLSRNFCQPILEAFVEELVAKGTLKAPGFLDDPVKRSAWCRALWIGPGNGQIDPNKEAKASVTKIQNNLSTHEEEYMADKGGRWDSAMQRKSQEMDLLEDLKINTVDRVANSEELTGPTGTDAAVEPGTTA